MYVAIPAIFCSVYSSLLFIDLINLVKFILSHIVLAALPFSSVGRILLSIFCSTGLVAMKFSFYHRKFYFSFTYEE
jgi:hypothetical protein